MPPVLCPIACVARPSVRRPVPRSPMPGFLRRSRGPLPSVGAPHDDEEEDVIVRESICALAYSPKDLDQTMRTKLKDSFKLPRQDTSKIQMFDPTRRRCSLGGLGGRGKPGLARPLAPLPVPMLRIPGEVPEEEETPFEPLVLWRPAEAVPPEEAVVPEEGAPPPPPPPAPISVDGFLCRKLRPHQREVRGD